MDCRCCGYRTLLVVDTAGMKSAVTRMAVLAAIGYWIVVADPAVGGHGVLALNLAGYVIAVLGWLPTAFVPQRRTLARGCLHALFVLGGVLLVPGTPQSSVGVIVVCVAAMSAATAMREPFALCLTAAGAIATVALSWPRVESTDAVLLLLPVFGAYFAGVTRRQRAERLEQAELLLAETQIAKEREAHAAALDERTRLAREMHDVLAHSLGALTVQLEAADALLEGRSDAEKARACVRQARTLAGEGLAEARRAVGALREAPHSLPDALAELADAHDGAVSLQLPEEPLPLYPDLALALHRIAAEAVTNAGRHAPGSAVTITLAATLDEVRLSVDNGAGTRAPTAGGGGFGVVGMRERARRVGGELHAGPVADGWVVCATVPRAGGDRE